MNMPHIPRVSKWERYDKDQKPDKETMLAWFIAMVIIIFFYGLLFKGCAHAEMINMGAISKIESSNNPLAYNKVSQARGIYQITPIVLKEYNQFNKVNHSTSDLFNPLVNERIARWYLTVRIPQLLRHYQKPLTIENVIRSYNCGIRSVIRGYTPKETADYIKKYNKLTEGGC